MKTLTTILGLIICQLTFGQIPSLSIQNAEKKQDLEISQLKVNVDVVGNISTTTFDIIFYNPFNRNLEGELSLPLADGQEICRYALEVNGKLREGAIVEKIKARQTFEAVIRQNIDPGIANITKGNFFKTRIFPIPGNGTKRVVLAISETLRGDDDNLYYSLPLKTSKNIGEFKLDVKVVKSQSEDKHISTNFENIKFDNTDDAYCLNLVRQNFSSNSPLKFTIPRFSKSNHQLFTCEVDGQTYFYLIIKTPELSSAEKEVPGKITIYWDNSFSAFNRDIDKELVLLKNYLLALKGNKEVTLITFNQRLGSPKIFSIKQDPGELINYIKQLKNDGATCLDKIKPDKNCDEILLFSDAINTIGEDQFETSAIPVYSISSSIGSNYSFLKRVASVTDGEFIDLNFTSVDEALQMMLHTEEKFLSCNYNNSKLKEVFPNTPTRINGYFELAGILTGEKAVLDVNYGNSGTITKTQTFEISKISNTAISRIWAGKKIAALEMNYKRNEKEILQLGSKFNIVTPNTAFIVLDRVEDYVQYNISPPEELKDEYNKVLATFVKEKEVSPKVIHKRNLERIERLQSWYVNPIPTSTKNNTQSGENADVLFSISEADEVIPITREEGSNPPPPPPPPVRDVDALMMINDDLELAEESEVDDSPALKTISKPEIKVQAWLPDAPYMNVLRDASDTAIDSLYYVFKEENRNRPSFYIQVADFLFEKKMNDKAVRILSNTLELDLENPELLKVVAKRLMHEGEYSTAIEIYEEIKRLRPEEPQSFRDLALAFAANKQFQKALDTYLYILDSDWNRFEEIKDVVLNEFNNLILLHKTDLDIKSVNPEYIVPMPLDIRITIDWSSNENDIDLWVIDPNGEKCYYEHTQTKIGGKISSDFTRGYGPEEYSLKEAKRGTYTVYVNYFSEARQTITGPVTIYATLFTNYGTEQQEAKHITVQLADNKETRQIGQLEFEN
ncbi:VIT domain-containing protein [Maribellus sediminis]|uniref:VIT domain-containing protein n=1 Tax=Maribellus sediminis TaxID=2696285 RepID=UPI00142F8BFC|nr:VIT domain-containing protein [Maribellus sediminis]